MTRLDETPLRAATTVTHPQGPTPGTPPSSGKSDGWMGSGVASDPRFTHRWSRLIGSTIGSAVQRYLAGVIPAVVLNRFNPESYYPDEILAEGQGAVAAVAAQTSVICINNPLAVPGTGQPVTFIIERLHAWRLTSAGDVGVFLVASGVPIAGAPFPLIVTDTRQTGTPAGAPALSITSSNNIALAGTLFRRSPSGIIVAGAPPYDSPIILTPGNQLLVTPLTAAGVAALVNEGLALSIAGRVRRGSDVS